MASTMFTVLAAFALLLPSITLATQHIVGDDNGWNNRFDYAAWAATKVFVVGDTLVFKYTPPYHNVFKVNGTGFQNCIKPDPTLALTTGNDVITLATPGKKWYICGVAEHCSANNQKLSINVLEAAGPAGSPTSPTTPAPTSAAFSIKASSQIFGAVVLSAAVALAAAF